MPFFFLIARFVHSLFRSQRQLVLENLALRQQVVMLRQSVKKPRARLPPLLALEESRPETGTASY